MENWQIIAMDEIEAELQNFQWAFPNRGENRGEVHVNRDEAKIVLEVWCRDNDDPDNDEVKPLIVTKDIEPVNARNQIRFLIHDYLCHEADEQMWFGNERTFYPHA